MRTPWTLFCSAVLILSSCAPAERQTTDPTAVTIGAVYCLTGAQAELDRPSAHGAGLAIDHLNREGGLLGRPVMLALEDGATDTGRVTRAVRTLAELHPSLSVVLGLSDTDMARAAAIEARQLGRAFVTSGATSPHLPDAAPGYVFLACFGDNVQAQAAATWAAAQATDGRSATACVVFDTTDTYTNLLQQYFTERFTSSGGHLVEVRPFASGDTIVLASPLPSCDVIYLAAHVSHDALPMITKIRATHPTTPIIGGDGFDAEGVWETHPEISNVLFTTHAYLGADNRDPRVVDFREAYRQTYGTEPNAFAALGYDAVQLVALAIRRAGTDDPDSVRSALLRIERCEGITGTISYRDGSAIPSKTVSIIAVDAGKRSLKATVTP